MAIQPLTIEAKMLLSRMAVSEIDHDPSLAKLYLQMAELESIQGAVELYAVVRTKLVPRA